jgi:hypothetical protein
MLPVFAQPCHAWRMKRVVIGPVAQWSELAAHNRLVGGSSPPGPTNNFNNLYLKCLLQLNRESVLATPLATSCRLRRRILRTILPAQQPRQLGDVRCNPPRLDSAGRHHLKALGRRTLAPIAHFCGLIAQKATHPKDRRAWQTLGETWLDMLLPFERSPAIEAEKASQVRTTSKQNSPPY